MATTPDADVVTKLAAAGLGLTAGTNLFQGPVVAPGEGVPHAAVFALATGGAPPAPLLGMGKSFRESTVQIRVRSSQEDFATGQTLARAVRDALHTIDITGYARVTVRESEPNYLGDDETGHHHWSVNAELEHRQ